MTAIPYALRHLELAQTQNIQKNIRLGHQVLFVVECIPVIGILAAAIEYVVSSYFCSYVLNRKMESNASILVQKDQNESYIIPERRICNFKCNVMEKGFYKRKKIEKVKFIGDSDIIGQPHAMRFLPSPFQFLSQEALNEFRKNNLVSQELIDNIIADNEKAEKAIGVTKEGRHVILQQAKASCVPTAVAMIILDHGGKPNYKAIEQVNFADNERAINWFEEAGFSVRLTELSSISDPVSTLIQCLKEYGPGVLDIYEAGGIGGHAIVLDAISIEDGTATIRDPFHGWSIDIKLSVFEKIPVSSFIQITGKKV